MATADQLKEWDSIRAAKVRPYRRNEAYMRGKNPTIIQKEKGKQPDNRIPVPWAKSAVEDMSGYAAMPGNIVIDYPRVDGTEEQENPYQSAVREWEKRNNDDIEKTELYIQQLAHGRSFELWWADQGQRGEEAIPRWKRVPGDQIVLIYDDAFEPNLQRAVYFWGEKEGDFNALVLEPRNAEGWTKTKKAGVWARNEDLDLAYPYERVPVIEFYGNMHKESFFEAQKELIDAHDKLISSSQNEIDRFNALIALFPGEVSKEFVDKLRELRVIDRLEKYDAGQWPQYLEKQLEGVQEFYNQFADRMERLFHKTIKVPDVTNPEFAGGDESGVARAFKLLPMEFRAAMIDSYFNTGLLKRKALLDDVFRFNTSGIDPDDYTIVVTNKRNIPVDDVTKSQIAVSLKGILSDETILEHLPWVRDVEKEMQRLEQQRASNPLAQMAPEDEETPVGDGA